MYECLPERVLFACLYTVCVPCPERSKSVGCSESGVKNEAKDAGNPTQFFPAYFFATNSHLCVPDLSVLPATLYSAASLFERLHCFPDQ